MNTPEDQVLDIATQWLQALIDGLPRFPTEPEWQYAEIRLQSHLESYGFVPCNMSCGCCVLLGVKIKVDVKGDKADVGLEEIRRPKKDRLH